MPKDTKILILIWISSFKRILPSHQGLVCVDFWKQKQLKSNYKNCQVELTVMATSYTET